MRWDCSLLGGLLALLAKTSFHWDSSESVHLFIYMLCFPIGFFLSIFLSLVCQAFPVFVVRLKRIYGCHAFHLFRQFVPGPCNSHCMKNCFVFRFWLASCTESWFSSLPRRLSLLYSLSLAVIHRCFARQTNRSSLPCLYLSGSWKPQWGPHGFAVPSVLSNRLSVGALGTFLRGNRRGIKSMRFCTVLSVSSSFAIHGDHAAPENSRIGRTNVLNSGTIVYFVL